MKDLEGQIAALRRSSEQKDNEYAKSRNEKKGQVIYHYASCQWSF